MTTTLPARHPITGRLEQAEFLDGFYGPDSRAVRFRDGAVYPIDKVQRPYEVAQCEAHR